MERPEYLNMIKLKFICLRGWTEYCSGGVTATGSPKPLLQSIWTLSVRSKPH